MRVVLLALPLTLAAAGCTRSCARPTPEPRSLTVSALEHVPPPDAGSWSAKVLASKTTTDPTHIAVVAESFATAEKGTLIRCTFMEGGEPGGLRFDLPDARTIYVYGVRSVAKGGRGCWNVDATAMERLRALARVLDVAEPPRAR